MNHSTCAPHARQLSPIDVIEQFRAALIAADIVPPATILADGQLHRCDAAGKNGEKDAAYILHLDPPAMGGFQNHRDGAGWRTFVPLGPIVPVDMSAMRAAQAARQRDKDLAEKAAADKARRLWDAAKPAPADHPYLVEKRIGPGELRMTSYELLVPVIGPEGLCSLQFISEHGSKQNLSHGRMRECYCPIGRVNPAKPVVLICEGYATGATLHAATGHPVAVAFSSGNLKPVAMAMRRKRPLSALIICGDDDHATRGNPGRTAAQAAALAASGSLVMPRWPDGPQLGMTDFNDLAVEHGMDAVKACFDA